VITTVNNKLDVVKYRDFTHEVNECKGLIASGDRRCFGYNAGQSFRRCSGCDNAAAPAAVHEIDVNTPFPLLES